VRQIIQSFVNKKLYGKIRIHFATNRHENNEPI
jgi:hypothetical protein